MKNLRSAQLTAALDRALAGDRRDLFRQLELASGLPGPRVNLDLALAFAHDMARLGPKADELAYEMANLPADEARGASGKEFVVMCGVLAIGERAVLAKEKAAAMRALELLEARADDVRFRVRDAVPLALAMLGSKMEQELGELVEPWMDRYFHAAAVIRALAEPSWLETYAKDDYTQPINLLHLAFWLAHDAPRSAFRYPGHKALVEALAAAPKAIAKRFPQQMVDRYGIWAEKVSIPELRDVLTKCWDDGTLKKTFAPEIKRMKATMEGNRRPMRDEERKVSGMRGRGRKARA